MNKINVLISNIMWDTDDDDNDLPETVETTFDFSGDEDELSDTISDWLSNEYGYCHMGFNLKY